MEKHNFSEFSPEFFSMAINAFFWKHHENNENSPFMVNAFCFNRRSGAEPSNSVAV